MDERDGIGDRFLRIVRTTTRFFDNPSSPQLDWALRNIFRQVHGLVFPAISAERSAATREQRVKDVENWSELLRYSILLFMVATVAYMMIVLSMLPAEPFLQTSPIITFMLLGFAFHSQRHGLLPGGDRSTIAPINNDFRKRLARVLSRLLIGKFKPGEAPFRAGAIALMAVLMVFLPSYPVVRWLNGFPFAAGVTWAAIALRFFMVSLLFGWFAWIWKASVLAVKTVNEELRAIETEAATVCAR
jgi:hypothetical protein